MRVGITEDHLVTEYMRTSQLAFEFSFGCFMLLILFSSVKWDWVVISAIIEEYFPLHVLL